MKVFCQLLLTLALFSTLAVEKLSAQAVSQKKDNRNQLTVGVGFLGLLYLDEFRQETQFTRKALPPVFAQYDRQLWRRLSIGAYFGLEHEMQSGTFKDFDGPTTSLVSGLLTDFHFVRLSNRKFFDPYIGLSFFYYDSSGLEKTVLPGLRIGCNFQVYSGLKVRLNTGVGAALIETGLTYNF